MLINHLNNQNTIQPHIILNKLVNSTVYWMPNSDKNMLVNDFHEANWCQLINKK